MGIFLINLQQKKIKIKEGYYFPFHFTPSKKTGPPFLYQKNHKIQGRGWCLCNNRRPDEFVSRIWFFPLILLGFISSTTAFHAFTETENSPYVGLSFSSHAKCCGWASENAKGDPVWLCEHCKPDDLSKSRRKDGFDCKGVRRTPMMGERRSPLHARRA
ncbi:MAG: hypothetical protein NTV04_00680 [Deltaproteobacteria bacterium]|nr:hypothetical protein [Deltaproteobacteria bacterium]